MIAELIKKEIHDNLLTFRFTFGTLMLILLVIAVSWVNIQNYKDLNQEYLFSVQKNEEDLRDSRVYCSLKYEAIRPPEALSVFNLGVTDRLGNSLTISLRDIPVVEKKYTQENPLLNIFPSLDLTLVYKIVISLLAMLFAFDAFSGEKERGTLSLLLSHRISRLSIVVSKYFGNLITLAISFFISLLIMFIILIAAFPAVKGVDWVRILMFAFLTMFYISIFLILGMLISGLTKKSSQSLIFCLFFWIILVIVVPNLSTYIATVIRSVPPEKSVILKIREFYSETSQKIRDWEEKNQVPISLSGSMDGEEGRYILTSGNKETIEYFQRLIAFTEPLMKERSEKIWQAKQEYYFALRRQEKLASFISRISPTGLFQEAAEIISKTDIRTYENFIQQAQLQREAVYSYLESKNAFNSLRFFTVLEEKDLLPREEYSRVKPYQKPGGGYYKLEDFSPLSLEDFPRFEYKDIPLSTSLQNILYFLIVFVMVNFVFLAAAAAAFNLYDVR